MWRAVRGGLRSVYDMSYEGSPPLPYMSRFEVLRVMRHYFFDARNPSYLAWFVVRVAGVSHCAV